MLSFDLRNDEGAGSAFSGLLEVFKFDQNLFERVFKSTNNIQNLGIKRDMYAYSISAQTRNQQGLREILIKAEISSNGKVTRRQESKIIYDTTHNTMTATKKEEVYSCLALGMGCSFKVVFEDVCTEMKPTNNSH